MVVYATLKQKWQHGEEGPLSTLSMTMSTPYCYDHLQNTLTPHRRLENRPKKKKKKKTKNHTVTATSTETEISEIFLIL